MRRKLTIVVAVAVLALAGAGLALAAAGEEERPRPAAADPLLRSGATRYAAFLTAEAASLRAARRAGDRVAVRLHAGRLAPAEGADGTPIDPPAAAAAAAALLSLDARNLGTTGLLDVEAHAAGAAAAFDAIRDALWARDQGLTGSIDERLAGLRAELDRHRRGAGFRPAAGLSTPDRRRLAAALDAYAWRLTLAVERVGR